MFDTPFVETPWIMPDYDEQNHVQPKTPDHLPAINHIRNFADPWITLKPLNTAGHIGPRNSYSVHLRPHESAIRQNRTLMHGHVECADMRHYSPSPPQRNSDNRALEA